MVLYFKNTRPYIIEELDTERSWAQAWPFTTGPRKKFLVNMLHVDNRQWDDAR